jgi:hypothetical protein
MIDREHSRRPALPKLIDDVDELRNELLEGFATRADILRWCQRLSVRTLGELPDRWYREIGDQLRGLPDDERERTLISALLSDEYRRREIAATDARELRERMYVLTIRPAFHRAYRQLRADAGEYLDDDATESKHTAGRQRWIAMRPALDELEAYQQDALDELIGSRRNLSDPGGFDSKSGTVPWGDKLEQATNGELAGEFVARCYRETSTVDVLTGDDTASRRARELFWAVHIAPVCNRGVRDLAGRTSEQPDAEREEKRTPTA